ncbi:MAG: peptidoglycan-binding protein, partial [Hyphomicrobiales bacterium]|nr:peptidoglycan-binding protein [Hyphomicrobiales bacterium]
MLAVPAGHIAGSSAARADTGERWGFFGKRKSGPAQYYDRSQARNWEANPPAGLPTLSKANIAPMKAAIKRYAAIVAQGGWRPLPLVQMRGGMRGQAVQLLKQRLILSGDLDPRGANSRSYDYHLENAIKRFQIRNGLTPSGMVDRSTLMALNVSASVRLRQLRLNLARIQALAGRTASKYVMVNIPAAQIEAVDQDQVVSRHAVVVGKL